MAKAESKAKNYDEIEAVPGAIRFSHDAMATTFEILILDKDHKYAAQAAQTAFNELDRLEKELSRFIENSDISRINNAALNQELVVGLEVFECLQKAKHIFEETGGAFDVTVGSLMNCWLDKHKKLLKHDKEEVEKAKKLTGMNLLKLDERYYTVTVLCQGVHVDLGGIGKGYALDKMSDVLREWAIVRALIHGGGSTVLAMHAPNEMKGWPVTMSSPADRKKRLAKIFLHNCAVSGSGLAHGRHIIDPRKGEPIEGRVSAWSFASDGATADALSTAFMVMEPQEIERYCRKKPEVCAMIVIRAEEEQPPKDTILKFGKWREQDLAAQE
jgi:thiamine biosynthesis lipoprotein